MTDLIEEGYDCSYCGQPLESSGLCPACKEQAEWDEIHCSCGALRIDCNEGVAFSDMYEQSSSELDEQATPFDTPDTGDEPQLGIED